MLRTLCVGAAFAALMAASPTARAAEMVIGSGSAHSCYDAALHGRSDSIAVRSCDDALSDDRLSRHDRAATYVNRGILHLRRHSSDDAAADFSSAVRIQPDLAEAYTNRGNLLLQRGQYTEAKEAYDQALERSPADPAKSYYGRAIANEELGDVRAAYEDYRQASHLDPYWNAPRLELARFRVNGG